MSQVTLEQAVLRLPELLHQVEAGEEVWIMRDEKQIARIMPPEPQPLSPHARPQARRGSHKGEILYMAPDFDATPEEFEEYL